MEFILEQQAQLTARMQQLGEAHAVLEADQKRLAQNQLGLAEMQTRQQEMIGNVVTIVGTLVQAQQRTEQRVQEVSENLNALIKVVDDIIRRNGRPT